MKLNANGIIGAVESKTSNYDGKISEYVQVAVIVGAEAITCKTDNKDFLLAPTLKPLDLTFEYNEKYKSMKLVSYSEFKK